MDHGAPTSEAFEIWKGWVVSVVRNLQTGNRVSAGTLKIAPWLWFSHDVFFQHLKTGALPWFTKCIIMYLYMSYIGEY